MKKCPNPECNSHYLYGADRTVCPFCHTALVDSGAAPASGHILPPDRIPVPENDRAQAEPFLQERLDGLECHGRITELEHQELFHSKRLKLMNSLFRGEPYQLAHQTLEYTIRVEELTDDYPAQCQDFCMYGSYLGRLQVGDEVRIRAKNYGDRRVVKAIFNCTTGSEVRPGFQLSSGLVRVLAAVIVLGIFALVAGLIYFFTSGAFLKLLEALFMAIAPSLILIVLIVWLVKRCFSRR